MNTVKSSIIILLILFVTGCASTRQNCQVRDISGARTEKDIGVLKLTGNEWMQNAILCRIGEFEVATPAESRENNTNVILLFRKGKPVFYRHNGATYVYSPKLKDAAFDKILVNIWHGGDADNVDRLWYETIGKEPRVNVYDIDFDGQPDIRTVYKGNEIIEMYKWENNGWQRKEIKPKDP